MPKNKLFEVVQTAPLLNNAVSQAFGENAITTLNASGIIALGDLVLSSENNRNAFISGISNIVSKTIYRILDNEVEIPNILINGDDYLRALRKVSIKPMKAVSDSSYDLSTNTMWVISIPEVNEKIFGTCQPYNIDLTIPDKMLEPAFDGTISLDDFVVAIFDTIYKSMLEIANALVRLAICNFIAEKSKINNGIINLLTLYNEKRSLSEPLNVDSALFDKDFLAFASMTINNYIGYMKHTSLLFNDGSIERATQRDNLHVLVLQDFASSAQYYLESETYNNNLVALPLYNEVMCWQGTGDTLPNFMDNSTINIIPSSEEGNDEPVEVKLSNIVAVLFDREAIACSVYEDWSGADRNNRQRYTNYTFGENRGYYNDLSENGVIFTLN